MAGVLTDLQDAVVKTLKSDTYYARVTLLTEQAGDIANEIARALGKLGICAIAGTPEAVCPYPDAPGPVLDPLRVWVDIVEQVVLNRGPSGSQMPASDVAEHTAWLLHQANHAHVPARAADTYKLSVERIRMIPDRQYLVYRVELRTTSALAGIVTT